MSPQLTRKEEARRRKDSTKSIAANDVKRGSASSHEGEASPRVNKKFIENWRHACDRTRDRTKELLKKWRNPPEPDVESDSAAEDESKGWSEHIWSKH